MAAGLGAGALTAWIAELEPRKDRSRAAVLASAGNLGGLAFGGILSGVLAEYFPAPLRMAFAVYVGILLVTGALLLLIKETVSGTTRSVRELDLSPRIGVPADIRLAFIAPACMAFAAFALGRLLLRPVTGDHQAGLHYPTSRRSALWSRLFFVVASVTAAAQAETHQLDSDVFRRAVVFPGVVLLCCAESLRSFSLLFVAAAVGGAAMALSYRGSLQVVNEVAPQNQRAEVVSAYLLMCYLGNSLPVLGVGLLTTALERQLAHEIFAAVVAPHWPLPRSLPG